jgi:hypothetical protein
MTSDELRIRTLIPFSGSHHQIFIQAPVQIEAPKCPITLIDNYHMLNLHKNPVSGNFECLGVIMIRKRPNHVAQPFLVNIAFDPQIYFGRSSGMTSFTLRSP